MKTKDAYRLSRIQAEGWNEARARSSSGSAELDKAAIVALCPYRTDPERVRWVEGFCSAFKARQTVPGSLSGANTPVQPRKTLHLRKA